MTLYTLGYGQALPDVVLAKLPADVILLDVRDSPGGWHQGYTAAALHKRLGARYFGCPLLGNVGRTANKWQAPSELIAMGLIDGIVAEMQEGREFCLFCAERAVSNCHRRFIADAIADRLRGVKVVHL